MQSIIVGDNSPKGWCGWHLSAIKRKVLPHILKFAGLKVGVGSTYHEKEGAILEHATIAFSAMGTLGIGMWNLGSLIGKGGEISEELRKIIFGMYCLLERWRGQGARMLED